MSSSDDWFVRSYEASFVAESVPVAKEEKSKTELSELLEVLFALGMLYAIHFVSPPLTESMRDALMHTTSI